MKNFMQEERIQPLKFCASEIATSHFQNFLIHRLFKTGRRLCFIPYTIRSRQLREKTITRSTVTQIDEAYIINDNPIGAVLGNCLVKLEYEAIERFKSQTVYSITLQGSLNLTPFPEDHDRLAQAGMITITRLKRIEYAAPDIQMYMDLRYQQGFEGEHNYDFCLH